MVTWRAAAVSERRWDRVLWLASEWAPRKRLGSPFMNYWYKALSPDQEGRVTSDLPLASSCRRGHVVILVQVQQSLVI